MTPDLYDFLTDATELDPHEQVRKFAQYLLDNYNEEEDTTYYQPEDDDEDNPYYDWSLNN